MRYWSITLARKVVRRCTNVNIQASFGLGIASQKQKGPRDEHAALIRTPQIIFSLTRYDLTESARIFRDFSRSPSFDRQAKEG
jgi:hypothetical protein